MVSFEKFGPQKSVKNKRKQGSQPTFIDVFAGCGGLSLGLLEAGWKGVFAVEHNEDAFATLSKNLLSQETPHHYTAWPIWLPKEPHCAIELAEERAAKLISLRGNVDLMVGGPPCQGFSPAGLREADDPRNKLLDAYLKLVDLVQPSLVLIENVKGITQDFKSVDGDRKNYADELMARLSTDYFVFWRFLDVSSFGVPQSRTRFFLIGVRKPLSPLCSNVEDPFHQIESSRLAFLLEKGLSNRTSTRAAISDLEVNRNGEVPSPDTLGFSAISYSCPLTHYQELMHRNFPAGSTMSDTRLARHSEAIQKRFSELIDICNTDGRLNVSISKELKNAYGLKKQAIRVLASDIPAPTVTSMPDDLIHYSEPRALTVRENARLQSFPDWFEFAGRYTTGSTRRKTQVPRFTQVANAVPPLVSECFGIALKRYGDTLKLFQTGPMPPASSRNQTKCQ